MHGERPVQHDSGFRRDPVYGFAVFHCGVTGLRIGRKRNPPDPILVELAKRGNAHESMVLDGEQPGAVRVEPESKPEEIGGMNVRIDGNNNEESFLLGIEAMVEGAGTISKAMLFYLPDGMVGIPDILRRASGRSAFGQHHYTVVEIKSARTITPAHKLQAAFYTALIGRIQGRTPETFQMINGNGACEELRFDDYRKRIGLRRGGHQARACEQQAACGVRPGTAPVDLVHEQDGNSGGQRHVGLRGRICDDGTPERGRNNDRGRYDVDRHRQGGCIGGEIRPEAIQSHFSFPPSSHFYSAAYVIYMELEDGAGRMTFFVEETWYIDSSKSKKANASVSRTWRLSGL